MQYQNVFALGDKTKVIKTYWLASAILVFVITGMSFITGSIFTMNPGIDINPDVVQMYVIQSTFGLAGVIFFMLTILFKASSVIDSTINGAGTLISNDIIKRSNPINVSRWAMAIVMIIATLIAIYRIDIWILVSTFGLLRIIMIAPTLYALLSKKKIPTELLFYVLASITILGIGSTFTTLPIDRANIDTDTIIPKQYLKSVKKTGFGPNLFDDWRYLTAGEPGQDHSVRKLNTEFIMNNPMWLNARTKPL